MPSLRKDEYIEETLEVCELLVDTEPDTIRKVFMDRIPEDTIINREYVETTMTEKMKKSSVDRCKKIHRLAMLYVQDHIGALRTGKTNSDFYNVCSMVDKVASSWNEFEYGYRHERCDELEVQKELKLIEKKTGALIEESFIDKVLKDEIKMINEDAEIQKLKNHYYGLKDVSVIDDRTARDIERANQRAMEAKNTIKKYRAELKAKKAGFDLGKLEREMKAI